MSTPPSDVHAPAPEVPPPARRVHWPLGVGIALVVGILAVVGVAVVPDMVRGVPSFPSLADTPDPSLHGTVAYFDDGSRCVRIVAAAGRPAKDVLCLPAMDVPSAQKLGKEIGPQLVWRTDGQLEVTMFRMPFTPGPGLNPGWQKVVDVRTGTVTDTPEADVPYEANTTSQPSVSPSGARLTWTSDDQTGRVRITVTDANGTRTLLSARGPGSYTYGLHAVFWPPDGRWVAADDGRLLVITPSEPPVTRVLVDRPGGPLEDFPRFAVTSADLLAATG